MCLVYIFIGICPLSGELIIFSVETHFFVAVKTFEACLVEHLGAAIIN